jgi:hypothetical protein
MPIICVGNAFNIRIKMQWDDYITLSYILITARLNSFGPVNITLAFVHGPCNDFSAAIRADLSHRRYTLGGGDVLMNVNLLVLYYLCAVLIKSILRMTERRQFVFSASNDVKFKMCL